MRTLTSILTAETHALHSDHPLVFLAELEPGDGPTERYTNARDDITFHGLTFTSRPFFLRTVGEGTATNPRVIEAVVGNANLYVSSLKENYWRGSTNPLWIITLWFVDADQPDEVPLAANVGVYRVTQIRIDDITGLFRLAPRNIRTTRNLRQRRFSPSGGFPYARIR